MNGRDLIRATTIASGTSTFYRESAIPLAELLEELSADSELELGEGLIDEEEILRLNRTVRAEPVTGAALLGILLSVASWAAKKFLDELYAAKIQPRIREWLNSQPPSHTTKNRDFLLGIWLSDRKVLVLLRLRRNQFHEMAPMIAPATDVLRSAIIDATETDASPGVLEYRLEGSSDASLPRQYKTFREALDDDT